MSDGLGVETLLFIRGTQHNAPTLIGATKIVGSVKVPRFCVGFTLNYPRDISYRKIGTLRNELVWLKVGTLVAILSVKSTQSDHVFDNWLARLPRG